MKTNGLMLIGESASSCDDPPKTNLARLCIRHDSNVWPRPSEGKKGVFRVVS